MNAFAQFTVPEIKAGLLAVIALGATAVTLFVVLAMAMAAARVAARQIARLGSAASALVRNGADEAKRAS